MRYKASIIISDLIRVLFLLLSVLLRPIIWFFESSYLGRRVYFECQASNTLLLAKTDRLNFFVSSSDSIIGKSTYCRRVPFDSGKLFECFELIKKLRGGD